MRTCLEIGVETVAIYSEVDKAKAREIVAKTGVPTTILFHLFVLRHPDFVRGTIATDFAGRINAAKLSTTAQG